MKLFCFLIIVVSSALIATDPRVDVTKNETEFIVSATLPRINGEYQVGSYEISNNSGNMRKLCPSLSHMFYRDMSERLGLEQLMKNRYGSPTSKQGHSESAGSDSNGLDGIVMAMSFKLEAVRQYLGLNSLVLDIAQRIRPDKRRKSNSSEFICSLTLHYMEQGDTLTASFKQD